MTELQVDSNVNTEPKSSGLATASLVLGILGLVLFWTGYIGMVLDVLAIIFGGVTLSKAKKENITNKGLGKAGLIMGIIGFVIDILALIVFASILASLMGSGALQ